MIIAESFDTLTEIPLDQLHPSKSNPRSDLGDLDGLVASIRAVGIIEPLVVAANGPHGYTVAVGHRRLAAARLAGLETAPCVHRGFRTTAEMVEVATIENLQRQDLAPLDEARAMQLLVDLGRSQRDIAERIGCHQSHVSRRLALLELDDNDAEALATGTVTIREAERKARRDEPAVQLSSEDRVHALATRMAQEPRVAASGRSLDWAGYRIRLEAPHGDPDVPLVVETIAKVLRSEAAAFKRSLKQNAKKSARAEEWVAAPIEPSEVSPDAAEVLAGNDDANIPEGTGEASVVAGEAREPADAPADDSTPTLTVESQALAEQLTFDAPAEALTRAPWGGYPHATEAKVLALVAQLATPGKVRHVVVYEWSHERRPEVITLALGRLDELEAG